MFENLALIYFTALIVIVITFAYLLKKNIAENKERRLRKSKQTG